MLVKALGALLLRGVSLLGRLYLVVRLGATMTPEAFGTFGLLMALIAIGTFVAGLDYYAYANRELATGTREAGPDILLNQAVFSLVALALFAAPFSLLCGALGITGILLALCVALLVIEYVALELGRVLVALGAPVASQAVLLVKNGLWPFGLIAFGAPTVADAMTLWLTGAGAAAVVAVIGILVRIDPRRGRLDPAWIRRGMPFVGTTFFGSLGLKLTENIDRVLIAAMIGSAAVAPYTFFLQMANTAYIAVATAVTSITFVQLNRAAQSNRPGDRATILRIVAMSGAVAVTTSLAIGAVQPWLLAWMDKPAYADDLVLYVMLALGLALAATSLPLHYALLAANRLKVVTLVGLAAGGVACLLALVLIPMLGAVGAATATLAAYIVLFAGRTAGFLATRPAATIETGAAG